VGEFGEGGVAGVGGDPGDQVGEDAHVAAVGDGIQRRGADAVIGRDADDVHVDDAVRREEVGDGLTGIRDACPVLTWCVTAAVSRPGSYSAPGVPATQCTGHVST
jgi:hypothetical protein